MARYIVTGGAGFIGSAVCFQLLVEEDAEVIAVDKMTYAANPATLDLLGKHQGFRHVRADIRDAAAMDELVSREQPDAIFHLAAESHVDRSIDGAGEFVMTNVVGTFVMLQAARRLYDQLDAEAADRFRFLHISTDEVFGSLGEADHFSEETGYNPSSPYSASKAGSDHLVRAWYRTYGLPTIVSNCSNNYGPRQFPEKLIPLMILKALAGEALPVYGTGQNVRDWLHVDDHARALRLMVDKSEPGEVYCLGGDCERTNLEIVEAICNILDRKRPKDAPHKRLIEFVQDRPGHDFRYAVDAGKITRELGWTRRNGFEAGLEATVDWYLANEVWWRPIQDGQYRGQRLGTAV
ncbi:MAG: dTDP-glucose 4,6-dehydratase [Hyphomonadaceae bacterium BRH_c29]|nr:MAG: dTDP-glucose 4,6-dehydratase [Hyphomonadaceae bacterium BRH_c29]